VGKNLMKKLFAGIFIFLLFLTFSYSCKANIIIYPEEVSIKMDEDLIYGNTSKRIVVTNNNKEEFNVTWYLENPTPPSKIRPNRTIIPDLKWIDLEPKWKMIPPRSSGIFYIHLNIPKTKNTVNKKWESWITFKSADKEFFNIEYAIRFYIDTPTNVPGIEDDDGDFFSIKLGDPFTITLSSVAIVIAIFLTVFVLKLKIKRKNK
jgi:hypothetical protein